MATNKKREKEKQDKKEYRMNWELIVGMVIFFACLQWMWPNVIHEPLHYAAMRIQGVQGYMTMDWGFPPHPSTTHTTGFASISGALLFYLLPSIVSVLILAGLWATRKWANVWTHFVLAAYLGFDLLVNILTFQSRNSDFKVLQVIGGWELASLGAVLCIVLTVPLLMKALMSLEQSAKEAA
jgi:hypothetical protein